ncbi:Hfq-related RNA-binding protein [Allocoleopsis sp.]|uniref:Hfq-related RNA-binding protein n=1 Tax=Allocoleopsis sp. TaxID=3088169 RepID=UPI002FCEAE2A
MAEFDTGLPSVRQIQGLIKDGKEVEVKILTQDSLIGQLLWQDSDCICLATQEGIRTIIWRHAIAYIKPQDVEEGSRALQVRQ